MFDTFIRKHKKGIYVFLWAVISLISSYNGIIKWDFSFITQNSCACEIYTPLLIWTVAFFADYIYTISFVSPNEELDKKWTQNTYISICCIFIILVMSAYYHKTDCIKVIWMLLLFYNMIRLKIASLSIIRPEVPVKSV